MVEKRALVTGSTGFIGHHLVDFLKEKGYWVRGVDWQAPEYAMNADDFIKGDMRYLDTCREAVKGIDHVYALAADMGGMGFIQSNHGKIGINNTAINLNTAWAALEEGVERYFYSSSACIYPLSKQQQVDAPSLKESDAMPAEPEDMYGWEKLYAEQVLRYASEDAAAMFPMNYTERSGMTARIARFHNIFGAEGEWIGGREKAPAALCRKVAVAKATGDSEIELWGDGKQTRSFLHIEDCLEGFYRLMHSDHSRPLNIGQDEMISINDLGYLISDIAGHSIDINHVPGFLGVRGRNSDNTECERVLNWSPSMNLKQGLEMTYPWIEARVLEALESGLYTPEEMKTGNVKPRG